MGVVKEIVELISVNIGENIVECLGASSELSLEPTALVSILVNP